MGYVTGLIYLSVCLFTMDRLQNDLYCVRQDIKPYSLTPYVVQTLKQKGIERPRNFCDCFSVQE